MPDNRVGSGFTNIQNILNANKNNQLGQAVGTGITQVGQKAKNDIGTAQGQFQEGIGKEQARQAGEQTEANQVINGVTSGTAPTAQQVTDFQNIRAGQYLGPQGLQNTQNLIGNAQTAQNLGQASSSMGGRQGLLQRFAGKGPNYNAGQQQMDNLLLGQTGGQQLQQARQNVAGLGNYAQNQVGAANAVSQATQGQAQGLAQNVIGQLGGAVTNFDTAQQAAAQQAQKDRDASIAQMQADLTSGKLTQTEMNQLDAITNNRFDPTKATQLQLMEIGSNYDPNLSSQNLQLYGQDLNKYASMDNTQANQYNTLTDADVAKINALQQLSGSSLSGAPSGLLSGYGTNTYQKGALQATPLLSQFDTMRAQQDIANANNSYMQEMKGYNPGLATLQSEVASNPNAVATHLDNPGGLEYIQQHGGVAPGATNKQLLDWLNGQIGLVQSGHGYGQNIQIRPDGTPVSPVTGS